MSNQDQRQAAESYQAELATDGEYQVWQKGLIEEAQAGRLPPVDSLEELAERRGLVR